jgi:hypothetical protein
MVIKVTAGLKYVSQRVEIGNKIFHLFIGQIGKTGTLPPVEKAKVASLLIDKSQRLPVVRRANNRCCRPARRSRAVHISYVDASSGQGQVISLFILGRMRATVRNIHCARQYAHASRGFRTTFKGFACRELTLGGEALVDTSHGA